MAELAELEADTFPSKELVLLIAPLPKFSYLPPSLFKDQLYNIIYTAIVKIGLESLISALSIKSKEMAELGTKI